MEKLIFCTLCACSVLLVFLKTAVCANQTTMQSYNSAFDVSNVVDECSNCSVSDTNGGDYFAEIRGELERLFQGFYKQDVYELGDGVTIRRVNTVDDDDDDAGEQREARRSSEDAEEETQLVNRLERYARTHVVEVNLPQLANAGRELSSQFARKSLW